MMNGKKGITIIKIDKGAPDKSQEDPMDFMKRMEKRGSVIDDFIGHNEEMMGRDLASKYGKPQEPEPGESQEHEGGESSEEESGEDKGLSEEDIAKLLEMLGAQ